MQTKQVNYKLRKLNGDVLTPINLFLRLQGEKKFLLESSLKHSEQGRYSFIGVNPVFEVIGSNDETILKDADGHVVKQEKGLPLEFLKKSLPQIDLDVPFPFYGGAIGYVGYDAIFQYRNIGEALYDEIDMPDFHFMVYEDIIVFDHLSQKIYILTIDFSNQRSESELETRIQTFENQISQKETDETLTDLTIDFKPQMERDEFIRRIEQARQYVENGEVLQVVLSQRMVGNVTQDPFHFYRLLRNTNPSPYMFYVDFKEYIVLGASPESFVKSKGEIVSTNPIAGTRPRGKTEQEDKENAEELLKDEKELSEHRMLVDLSKEDFSEIVKKGSIQLTRYMQLEYYQYVMHIVSEMEGTLQDGKSGLDALIACLPAGTVSGAPKTRAMQIINELEERKRGVYAGAIGYVNLNGDIDFALAIRSLIIKNQKAYLQAGAGIVVDSIPENEYLETMNKAGALLRPER